MGQFILAWGNRTSPSEFPLVLKPKEGAEAKPRALPLGTVSNHLPEAQHCSALSAFPPETSHFTLTLSTSRPLDHCGEHHTASSLSKAYSERIQKALRSLWTERCKKQKGRKRGDIDSFCRWSTKNANALQYKQLAWSKSGSLTIIRWMAYN